MEAAARGKREDKEGGQDLGKTIFGWPIQKNKLNQLEKNFQSLYDRSQSGTGVGNLFFFFSVKSQIVNM